MRSDRGLEDPRSWGESGVKVPWSWDDEDWKILGIGMVADFEDPRI